MAEITPDIIQWLLVDKKVGKRKLLFFFVKPSFQVVEKWRSLARRLGLSESIISIECWRGGRGGMARGRGGCVRGWTEKDKLEMLFGIWKEEKPDEYNIQKLTNVLAEEVKLTPNKHYEFYYTFCEELSNFPSTILF